MNFFRPWIVILILATLAPSQGQAILGGTAVKSQDIENRVKLLDTRVDTESVVCTPTAIGNRQLLTAAHCFQHISDKNCFLGDQKPLQRKLASRKVCNVTLQINGVPTKNFQIHRHPRSVSYTHLTLPTKA